MSGTFRTSGILQDGCCCQLLLQARHKLNLKILEDDLKEIRTSNRESSAKANIVNSVSAKAKPVVAEVPRKLRESHVGL